MYHALPIMNDVPPPKRAYMLQNRMYSARSSQYNTLNRKRAFKHYSPISAVNLSLVYLNLQLLERLQWSVYTYKPVTDKKYFATKIILVVFPFLTFLVVFLSSSHSLLLSSTAFSISILCTHFILSVPLFTANLYCICLSEHETQK